MSTLMSDIKAQPFKLTDYERIDFNCDENFRQRKPAWKIGSWLAVSYSFNGLYKIYRIDTGKPLISVAFDKSEDAVKTAQILSDSFEEYFNIWENYQDADVVSLAKWSVRNGILIHEILKSLPPRVKSMEDIEQIANNPTIIERIKGWYGRFARQSV